MANIQNTFETEQAIPEKDCYRFSKLHAELTTFGEKIDKTVISAAIFLEAFDEEMAIMEEAGVPEEGRILYVTPSMKKIVKKAEGLQRVLTVNALSTVKRKARREVWQACKIFSGYDNKKVYTAKKSQWKAFANKGNDNIIGNDS